MLQLSSNEPAKLMESAGKAEDIIGTSKLLASDCLRNICGDVPRSVAGGASSCGLLMMARALCSLAVNDVKVANTTDAEEDGQRSHHAGRKAWPGGTMGWFYAT